MPKQIITSSNFFFVIILHKHLCRNLYLCPHFIASVKYGYQNFMDKNNHSITKTTFFQTYMAHILLIIIAMTAETLMNLIMR